MIRNCTLTGLFAMCFGIERDIERSVFLHHPTGSGTLAGTKASLVELHADLLAMSAHLDEIDEEHLKAGGQVGGGPCFTAVVFALTRFTSQGGAESEERLADLEDATVRTD